MMNQIGKTKKFRAATEGKLGAAVPIGHVFLLLFELLVVVHAFAGEGFATLRFYTTDSNLLCGVTSALYLWTYFRGENVKGSEAGLLTLLRFIATACLLVTFTVVLLVLGPENGFAHEFLDGTRLFSHLLCPFLSLILFLYDPPLCRAHDTLKRGGTGLGTLQLLKDSRAERTGDRVLDCGYSRRKRSACLGRSALTAAHSTLKRMRQRKGVLHVPNQEAQHRTSP